MSKQVVEIPPHAAGVLGPDLKGGGLGQGERRDDSDHRREDGLVLVEELLAEGVVEV